MNFFVYWLMVKILSQVHKADGCIQMATWQTVMIQAIQTLAHLVALPQTKVMELRYTNKTKLTLLHQSIVVCTHAVCQETALMVAAV